MLLITQGHESSIGIEVFIKSFLLLSKKQQNQISFFCVEDSLLKTLKSLNLKHSIDKNILSIGSSRLICHFSELEGKSQTLATLDSALSHIDSESILITMPSSKDQFFSNSKNYNGYTEYLRNYFNKDNLAMGFYYNNMLFNLITDHVPLKEVISNISSQRIIEKTIFSIEGMKKLNRPIDELYFSGINPHAGENGLLGTEENEITTALKSLEKKYPKINFLGPISGDILSRSIDKSKNQIFTYFHHDQGLGVFKSMNEFYGINITFGLPFLRMSVDHGTAFDLFGLNIANPTGCHYMLKTALKLTA